MKRIFKFLLILFFYFIIISFHLLISSPAFEKEIRINAKVLFDTEREDFDKMNLNFYLVLGGFAYDDGIIFALDRVNHRILKLSEEGEIIGQIGQIGQDEQSLYKPQTFFIKKGLIYIINGDNSVKVYDLNGKFKKKISIQEELYGASSIVVSSKKMIFLDSKNKSKFLNKKLISCFNESGKLIKIFGNIITTKDIEAYCFFNKAKLTIDNKDNIYGAFFYYPVIFKYTSQGRLGFYKNLRKSKIKGVLEIDKFVKESNLSFETPENVISEDGIYSIRYIFGIEVIKNNLLCGIRRKIYIFDLNGNYKNKVIKLFIKNVPFILRGFALDRKNREYVLGYGHLKDKYELKFIKFKIPKL